MEKTITVPTLGKDEVLIVKVGSEERPATDDNIKQMCDALAKCVKNRNLSIVTHHVIDFVVVKRSSLNGAIVQSEDGKMNKTVVKTPFSW